MKILRMINKKEEGYPLFLDLEKAYDRINRTKLLQILEARSDTEGERKICELIRELIYDQTLIIGDQKVHTQVGIA